MLALTAIFHIFIVEELDIREMMYEVPSDFDLHFVYIILFFWFEVNSKYLILCVDKHTTMQTNSTNP